MKTRHKPSEVRRHEIVDAARRIILTRGIGHLTIEAIAEEVGLTEGAIYRHFTGKQDVLLSLLEEVERAVLKAFQGAREKEGSALRKLEKMFEADLSYLEEREGTAFIVTQAANLGDPEIQVLIAHFFHKYVSAIQSVLAEGVKLGEFREDLDLEAAAILFLGMVRGAVMAETAREEGPRKLSRWYLPLWAIYRDGIIS